MRSSFLLVFFYMSLANPGLLILLELIQIRIWPFRTNRIPKKNGTGSARWKIARGRIRSNEIHRFYLEIEYEYKCHDNCDINSWFKFGPWNDLDLLFSNFFTKVFVFFSNLIIYLVFFTNHSVFLFFFFLYLFNIKNLIAREARIAIATLSQRVTVEGT